MVNVKFYVPSQKAKFTRSILNPNYDANLLRYMSKNKSIHYREDSDEEEDFEADEYAKQYKKEMTKYDYTSSASTSSDYTSSAGGSTSVASSEFGSSE